MIDWPKSDVDFNKIESNNVIELLGDNKLDIEFYYYALKFKKSGNVLTQYLLKKFDITELDTYFFSIAFLYRHSIELILKAIGFKYIINLDERRIFIKDTFHNLLNLLETVSPYIRGHITQNEEGYIWLKEYFIDIDNIDKESDSFRYPFRITTEEKTDVFKIKKRYSIKMVFDKQTHIDLVKFVNKLEIAFGLLSNIYKEEINESEEYLNYTPTFMEEGGQYYGQSVVGYSYNLEKFHPYVQSYSNSALYLYKEIYNNNSHRDDLFIPMCYLYRNSVELSLKEILFEECSFSFQESLRYINKKKHKVYGLWNLIKHEIEKHANAPNGDDTIKNVEKYIVQLNDIDSSSDKFRYPTNKHLNLHFNKLKKFDIENVNSFFRQLLSFLGGVNAMMSAHNEWKREMEAIHRSEMEAMHKEEMWRNQ